MNKKKLIADYLYILIGSFILALAINMFLVPFKISTGGASGVSTILFYLLSVPMSVSMLVINMFLFAFGYKMLPKSSIIKTFVGIVALSVFLEVTAHIGGYKEDMMIAAVFGGLLAGVGMGLVVSRDASTGGSDFAALIFNRLIPHISVAGFIMAIDTVIVLASGVAFKDYTIMFYSVIALYIGAKVADLIMIRSDFAKSVQIVSGKAEEISKMIIEDMDRGVTGIYSKGIYKNNDSMMLLCIVKSRELPHLLGIVKSVDKNAFVIVSEVRQVLGEGFKDHV